MGTAITFAELMAATDSEKVVLAELNLAEVATGWTATGGQANTYDIDYLIETVTFADGSTDSIRKEASALQEDGAALTARANVAAVDANAGSYWHDTANSKLYVHPVGSDSPLLHTMIVFFWVYVATEGTDINSRYYEPYIDSVPTLAQSNPNIHWGVSRISAGSLKLINNSGYFDQISKSFLWINKKIKLLLGGDNLPYSEYQALFTGAIVDKGFTRQGLVLKLRSTSFDLLRRVPPNTFLTSNFANLDPAVEGCPIPIFYGNYSEAQAPIVTCINTAYAATTYQFQICDHGVLSIDQVYVDYGDGAGWQAVTHANEDTANARFTVADGGNPGTFVVGTSRCKVDFQGKHSAGSLLERGPDIVEDLLINVVGYASGNLNAAAFTASKAIDEFDLNVPIEKLVSALSVIERCCRSDLAYFDEDGDGLLRYRIWEPTQSGTEPAINETDLLETGLPAVKDDTSTLYARINVGYSYRCWAQSYLYKSNTDDPSRYKYNKEETLTLKTYIRGASHASTLGQRLLFIMKDPSPLLSGTVKLPLADKLLGDKIKVTMVRAPFSTAGGYDERLFELFGISLSFFPVTQKIQARDLREYGGNVGFWTEAAAPNWGAATQQQKDDQGFWTDANGYADPADDSSLNISMWW